ncbi:hypothetical protein QP162_20545 [Sphingomonas aurantiaca]|uniref:hypothetical protein n=1 Tax=Sphingomonas aurantiaca TaxID=185949 RepID=UPI002FE1AC93
MSGYRAIVASSSSSIARLVVRVRQLQRSGIVGEPDRLDHRRGQGLRPVTGLPDQPLEWMPLATDMDQRTKRIECDCTGDRRWSIEAIGSGKQAGVQLIADVAGADHGIGDHRRVRVGRFAEDHDRLVSPIAAGEVS